MVVVELLGRCLEPAGIISGFSCSSVSRPWSRPRGSSGATCALASVPPSLHLIRTPSSSSLHQAPSAECRDAARSFHLQEGLCSSGDSEPSDLNKAGATTQMVRAGSTGDWEPVRPSAESSPTSGTRRGSNLEPIFQLQPDCWNQKVTVFES